MNRITLLAVADLEQTEPAPLGDGLTPSFTIMLANAKFWSFYCMYMVPRMFKMKATSDFLSDSFRVHQIRFRPEEREKNLFATNNNGIKQEKQRNNTEVSS